LSHADEDAREGVGLGLLVDEGVHGNGGLAGLPVADDELVLAATDGDERVHGLEAGEHELGHGLARDDAGGLDLGAGALAGVEVGPAVDGLADAVHDAAEELVADGTSAMAPVRWTASPSRMSTSLPKRTTPTLSSSRLRAMPRSRRHASSRRRSWIEEAVGVGGEGSTLAALLTFELCSWEGEKERLASLSMLSRRAAKRASRSLDNSETERGGRGNGATILTAKV